MKALVLVALVAVALGAFLAVRHGSASSESGVVARVIDGDTIVLVSGTHVRLVQIDTPEKADECYGQAASDLATRLLPPGTHVRIELDPRLDHVDAYHRELGYVLKGSENVNVELVRAGAAGVWFFDGKRGRHADELLAAAGEARAQHRGLWAACPQARFDPLESMSSGPAG